MTVSKFERVLVTRIDRVLFRLLRKMFSWLYIPIIDAYRWTTKSIKVMYYDFDTWEEEGSDFDDTQLFKLGLDVERINDKKKYWGYDIRSDRDTGDRNGRSRSRPPEWV